MVSYTVHYGHKSNFTLPHPLSGVAVKKRPIYYRNTWFNYYLLKDS